jgi:hypothetical protein
MALWWKNYANPSHQKSHTWAPLKPTLYDWKPPTFSELKPE